jgi:prephenate dehydrogenase
VEERRVAVIGLGLIGGSIARALARRPELELVAYDRRPGVRSAALRAGIRVCPGPESALAGAAAAIIAVPPETVADEVERALACGVGLVTDTAAVKAPIEAELRRRLSPEQLRCYIGGHPLAGSQHQGWEAGSATLLRGCTWAVCAPEPQLDRFLQLGELLEHFDARIVACEATAHDAAVARSSHLAQMLEVALAAKLADEPSTVHLLSGPALRDLTRLAEAPYSGSWQETLSGNRDELCAAVDELIGELADLRQQLQGEQAATSAETLWRHGQLGRERLLRLRWREPRWRQASAPLGTWWRRLVDLGERGVAIRRPHRDGLLLGFERTA